MSTQGGLDALLAYRPELDRHLRALGRYFRAKSPLPADLRELAIMATARAWGSRYVWEKHWARASGLLSAELLAALDAQAGGAVGTERESIVVELCAQLCEHGGASDDLWSRAVGVLGLESAVDLLAVLGVYRCVVALAGTPAMQADGAVERRPRLPC